MTLGRFRLEGIPPAPRGLPQIEVTFDIDANGILHVMAKDKATGKEQQITITASTNLSKQDVDRMMSEAQRNASADNRRREVIQARNEADTVIYQAEKSLRDLGDKVAQADRARVEAKITELKSAMTGEERAADSIADRRAATDYDGDRAKPVSESQRRQHAVLDRISRSPKARMWSRVSIGPSKTN